MFLMISKDFAVPFIASRIATLEAMSDGEDWFRMTKCDRDELDFIQTLQTDDEKVQAVVQRYSPQCGDWYYQNDPDDWQCAA